MYSSLIRSVLIVGVLFASALVAAALTAEEGERFTYQTHLFLRLDDDTIKHHEDCWCRNRDM